MTPLFDIGANLLHSQFDPDRQAVLVRAAAAGVQQVIVTATDLAVTRRAIEYCATNNLACTAGIHPHDAATALDDWQDQLRQLATNKTVKAIGETGLDFNRNFSPKEQQAKVFAEQIRIAQELDKPLFVHDRDSDSEVYRHLIAAEHRGTLPAVVIHCFTGSAYELDQYLEAGFSIGITGWIADERRGADLRKLVGRIPLNNLLVETDAPFLKPHNSPRDFLSNHQLPSRLKRRNEPALLPAVVAAIAQCRDESFDQIAHATYQNAMKLFQGSE